MAAAQQKKAKKKGDAVVIKKYANRRLYDTQGSRYVTLEDLKEMVKGGTEFVVVDAKSNEDLTRATLTQIIFDQESKGYNVLPISFLRQIISFYDDSLQNVLPAYLESMMEQFTQNQDKMRSYASQFEQFSPFKQFEEISSENVKLFEETMKMWSNFNPMMRDTFGNSDDKK